MIVAMEPLVGATAFVLVILMGAAALAWNNAWYSAVCKKVMRPWRECLDTCVMGEDHIRNPAIQAYKQAADLYGFIMNPKWLWASDEDLGIPDWRAQLAEHRSADSH